MKMSLDSSNQTVIMWMPTEFPQIGAAKQGATAEMLGQIEQVLRPYLILFVASGTSGPFGAITPLPVAEIREMIQLVDSDGTRYRPINDEDMNADAKKFARSLGPALSANFPEGQEGNVIVFPGTTEKGELIADSTKEGSFSIRLAENEFTWRLPLGALVPSKLCPIDGEELSGSWKFCPWHGSRLHTATPQPDAPEEPAKASLNRTIKVRKNTFIRERPTGTSKSLAKLADGETVRIIGKAEGNYWEVQYGDLHGFVHNEKLKEDWFRRSQGSESGTRARSTTTPVRVGGNIRTPKRVKYVLPNYPQDAKEARVQGIVILEAIIDPNGNVTNVRVLQSIPLLDQSAIGAVRQWKYEPTLLEGVPVPIVMTVTVNYALN